MSRLFQLLLVLLAAGAAFLLWQRSGPAPEQEFRPALRVPEPDAAAKAAYFFEMMDGQEQVRLNGEQVAAWQAIGRLALFELGAPALDYLLAEARFETYRARPNRLYNFLVLLPRLPGAAKHPRFYPFLLHWLVPENCPPTVPGSDWTADLRQVVFAVFVQQPGAPAVPPCVEELHKVKPKRDLRGGALKVLLALGRTDLLRELFPVLPPNDAEPEPEGDLKAYVVAALYRMAAPLASEAQRDHARVMIGTLRRVVESDTPSLMRIQAAGALLRLGEASFEARLWDEYRAAVGENEDARAWAALDILSADDPKPEVRAICLKRLEAGDGSPGYVAAVRLLLRHWVDEDDVRARIWAEVEAGRLSPLLAVPPMAMHDRERAVAFLAKEIASGNMGRLQAAVRIATGKRLAELGPRLLDLVRSVPDQQRPFLYASLVQLGTRRVIPLLVAEMDPNRPEFLHGVAATELLKLGEGIDVLAGALERGDEAVLAALQRRVQAVGRPGIPDALLPGVLHALREQPSEDGRLTALFVLRCRGTLEGVRDGLTAAYRREPSRRVAKEIGKVIVELAHR